MLITVGTNEYELKTTLGVAVTLEAKFHLPLMQIFGKLDNANTAELLEVIAIAAGKRNEEARAFRGELLEEWDYMDLLLAVQGLLTRLMFSGSPEQQEGKIANFPAGEDQKNGIREMLGLPKKNASTESSLSGLLIESE